MCAQISKFSLCTRFAVATAHGSNSCNCNASNSNIAMHLLVISDEGGSSNNNGNNNICTPTRCPRTHTHMCTLARVCVYISCTCVSGAGLPLKTKAQSCFLQSPAECWIFLITNFFFFICFVFAFAASAPASSFIINNQRILLMCALFMLLPCSCSPCLGSALAWGASVVTNKQHTRKRRRRREESGQESKRGS